MGHYGDLYDAQRERELEAKRKDPNFFFNGKVYDSKLECRLAKIEYRIHQLENKVR